MARKPIVDRMEDGRLSVRTEVPPELWPLLVIAGRRSYATYVSPRVALTDEKAGAIGLRLLCQRLGEQLAAGSDLKWLGPDFQGFLAALTKTNQAPTVDGQPIDITKLHRSSKMKSGFVGVYAGGQGFRAMGKDFSGAAVVIGTYPTSEEAAQRRMLYYRRHNLAYGELETEMERWRKSMNVPPDMSDEALIAEIDAYERENNPARWAEIFGPQAVTIRPAKPSRLPSRDEAIARSQAVKQGPEQTALGFENGDLPPSLTDGWKPSEP